MFQANLHQFAIGYSMMAFAQGDALLVILGAICLASFGQGHNPNINLSKAEAAIEAAIKSSKGLGVSHTFTVHQATVSQEILIKFSSKSIPCMFLICIDLK